MFPWSPGEFNQICDPGGEGFPNPVSELQSDKIHEKKFALEQWYSRYLQLDDWLTT
jgi:hypothetical protein